MSNDALSEVHRLVAAHRAARARQLSRFVWITLAALIALPLFMLRSSGDDPGATMKAGIFALLPGFAFVLALVTRRRRLREIDDARRLLDRTDEIVWVFPTSTRTSVNGLATGTHQSISLVTSTRRSAELWAVAGYTTPLYDALRRALPHATFGYSKERVAQYNRDPSSMRVGAP